MSAPSNRSAMFKATRRIRAATVMLGVGRRSAAVSGTSAEACQALIEAFGAQP